MQKTCNKKIIAFTAFLILITLTPIAVGSLTSSVIIPATGTISATINVTATSGSAVDIQAAVNQVIQLGGKGNVNIPAGTFNFVQVGQPWKTVTVPAGINIFGAPNSRDTKGQNIEWKTVLVMPYGVPGGDITDPSDPYYSQQKYPIPSWFIVNGASDPTKPSRISDIKLLGYRYIDPTFRGQSTGATISQVIDFRFDHVWLQDVAAGIWIGDGEGDHPNQQCRGVVDHCKFINTNGLPYDPAFPMTGDDPAYSHRTVGYGVGVGVVGTSTWNPDPQATWGKYETDSAIGTVYIENCYFSVWRHCVSSGHGAHVVFRFNTIANDCGFGSYDAHGQYAYVGTRAVEVYNNSFLTPLKWPSSSNYWGIGMFLRGGAELVYNNTVTLPYKQFAELSIDGDQDPIQDTYIWGNTLDSGITPISNAADYVFGTDYTTQTPTKSGNTYTLPALAGKSSYQYTPYAYPHPLTLTP